MTILQGDRVLLERRRLNLNQDYLAGMIGVDRTYISRIERNQDMNVGIKTIEALANALGVSVSYLIGASESPLGEQDAQVLKEMAGEYVTVDVDSDEERRLVRSLMDEFNMLPRRAQQTVVEMVRLLRRMESDESLQEGVD